MKAHIDKEQERETSFQGQAQRFKEKFVAIVQTAVNDGRLPTSINLASLADRIQRIRFQGQDLLQAQTSDGFYNPNTHSILMGRADWGWAESEPIIEPDGAPVSMFHVIMHEAMHAASTKSVALREGKYEIIRSGLAPYVHDEEGSLVFSKLAWLEEAGSEIAAMRALNTMQSSARIDERNLLRLLCAKGAQQISENLVLDALFEDDPYGSNSSSTRLEQAIDGAYEPNFLVKLSEIADVDENYDTRWAIKYMESLPSIDGHDHAIDAFRKEQAVHLDLPESATWDDISEAFNAIERKQRMKG
jgi:hypothetical protein